MNEQERRLHARAKAQNVVTYISVGNKRVTAAIENISAGGVFLRTSMIAPVGTQVGLEFFEGNTKKTLMFGGIVVTVVEAVPGNYPRSVPGVGVKFGDRSIEQHRRVSALIETIEAARENQPVARVALSKSGPAASSSSGSTRGDAGPSAAIKRRRNRRVPTKEATANVRMKGDVVALSVPVTNVSMGGLFLQTTDRLPLGAMIDVELRLGGQSMVLSGEIVGEVARKSGAAGGLEAGISMCFGPMARRNADRLRVALAALSPAAAGGFEQEIVPGGFAAEAAVAVVAAAIAPPPFKVSTNEFDYVTRDLTALDGEGGHSGGLPAQTLRDEISRLRAEIRAREDRIAAIEKTLSAQRQR